LTISDPPSVLKNFTKINNKKDKPKPENKSPNKPKPESDKKTNKPNSEKKDNIAVGVDYQFKIP